MKISKIEIFCIVSLIISFYLSYFIDFLKKRECYCIYNQNNLYTKYYIIKKFLTNKECNELIREGNIYGKKNGWKTKRHDHFPTTDNEVTKNWDSYNILYNKINKILYPLLKKNYKLKKNKLSINELFIVKYDGNKKKAQKKLNIHQDGSEFSFVLALNDNYDGGGTYFEKIKKNISLETGDLLYFCGQTRHGALKVNKGVRYILAGFLNYNDCSKYFDDDSEDEDDDDSEDEDDDDQYEDDDN